MKKCEFYDLDNYPVAEIEMHSFEGGIYVISAKIDGLHVPVYEGGKRLMTRDLTSLRRRLGRCRCDAFFLVQSSAYDEMLGQPGKGDGNAMRIAISPLKDEYQI